MLQLPVDDELESPSLGHDAVHMWTKMLVILCAASAAAAALSWVQCQGRHAFHHPGSSSST